MAHVHPTKVILTSYSPERGASCNERCEDELVADLTVVDAVESFQDVQGRYNGHFGCSQLCTLRPGSILDGIDALCELARFYKQSTILVIHGDNAAELVSTSPNGTGAIIGTFQQVDDLRYNEDFTKVGNLYFVVR